MPHFVSIIVPVKNEEKFIVKCLDSLVNQTISLDNYEILIVDGLSTDKTCSIVTEYQNRFKNIRLLDNPKKIAPTAMNIGLSQAKGDVIIRVDGHCYVANDFVEQNLTALKESGAACVGGPIETLASGTISTAIAYGMMSPFGVGNALFRYVKRPCYVDTLAFGAYRTQVFKKIGNFDEELIRNQDDEFNLRLIESGERIYLTPKIRSFYYSRSSIRKLWNQYYQYGFWKVRVIQKHGKPASIRHLVPVVFVLSLIGPLFISIFFPPFYWLSLISLFSYVIINSLFSLNIGLNKGFKYIMIMPIVFATLHFSYGLGFLNGLFNFYIFNALFKR